MLSYLHLPHLNPSKNKNIQNKTILEYPRQVQATTMNHHLIYKSIKLTNFSIISFCFLYLLLRILGSSHQRCSLKKGVLENFAKLTEKHLCLSLFFNKPAFLLKRDSATGLFLWILRYFYEHFFYRAPPVAASACILLFSQKISWNTVNFDTMYKY